MANRIEAFLKVSTNSVKFVNKADPRNTKLELPSTGISLLDGIPAIGTKFNKAEDLGPQGRKNIATGKYKGAACFYFKASR